MLLSTVLAITAVVFVDGSRLTPPVLPLLVRNPYFSTWLPDARSSPPWDHWPTFWTGESIGFSVLARKPDSLVYPLLGRPQDSIPSNRCVPFR